jgi:hypothetical protein
VIGIIGLSHNCRSGKSVGDWGYIAGNGDKVMEYAATSDPYSEPYGKDDLIGVLVDLHSEIRSLSFFKNRKYLGISLKKAFST